MLIYKVRGHVVQAVEAVRCMFVQAQMHCGPDCYCLCEMNETASHELLACCCLQDILSGDSTLLQRVVVAGKPSLAAPLAWCSVSLLFWVAVAAANASRCWARSSSSTWAYSA